ncbi:MAG: hypothetical protein JSS28_01295 [Proteobacteria bacterium]|nr:hypothetical protein [Pseudomonadota bacterium]
MTIRKRGFHALALGLLMSAGLALAPSAFARGHVSIGINLPGVSLGYWSGGHRWGGYGYAGWSGYYGGYGGYYSPAYYGGYYGPTYSSGYYAPAPVYYGVTYSAPVYRTYYRTRYYDRGGDPRYSRDYDRRYDSDRGYGDRGYYHAGYDRGHSCGSPDPRYCR